MEGEWKDDRKASQPFSLGYRACIVQKYVVLVFGFSLIYLSSQSGRPLASPSFGGRGSQENFLERSHPQPSSFANICFAGKFILNSDGIYHGLKALSYAGSHEALL